MDVADWLRRVGLARYEAAFRKNDIDADLVPSLTAEDLKEIGISSVGHRRRLLKAIASFHTAPQRPGNPVEMLPSPLTVLSDGASTAERRQLTVMFCDLIGSTELSSRLDPEDLREIIKTYQALVRETIGHFAGFIARYVGDGVLIYFGWPEAQETDAERAVRAALAVIRAVGATSVQAEQLRVRIGIATGLVVIGEPIETGGLWQQTAIGETPNRAARLQGLAGPNSVVIDAATRHLVGTFFACCDLGKVELKGLPQPIQVFTVLSESSVQSRSEALYAARLTQLIGRDEELEFLLRRWNQAKVGAGRVVLLSGEPGIGKSRLLAALEEQVASEPHANLRYFCAPHYKDSALHPVIARWEQAAGFTLADTEGERLRKLEAILAPAALSPADVALLAGLFSIPVDGRYPQLELSPQRRKAMTFAALTRYLASLAHVRPVLMLFEDAHWADPSSLELFDTVIDNLAELPVLLVISFRPDFVAPWIGRAGVSLMALSRLNRRQSAALVAQIHTEHALPTALRDRIIAQTDGVPLFIEELTRAVLETALGAGGATPSFAIPTTLQASLMARLDRLPSAKQVAQIGAVIGRDFSHALLAVIARLPERQLAQGLDELVASGLAFRRGVPPEAVYSFKHVLVQDAAYDSLLRNRRAEIHMAIVALAEANAPNGGIEPSILGHHCAQAGLIAKAAWYYRIAGERSAERAAAVETRIQFERGLRFAGSLPEGADRHRLEAELLIALGRILLATKGQSDTEAAKVFERAIAVCRNLNDAELLARALFALGAIAMSRAELNAVQAISDDLSTLAAENQNTKIAVAACVRLGILSYYQGRFTVARDNLSQALTLCAQEKDLPLDMAITSAPDVAAAAYLANTLACLGYAEQAAIQAELAVARAGQLGSSSLSFSMALSTAGRALLVMGDDSRCREYAEALVSTAEEQSFPQYLALGRCLLGWLTAKQGHVPEGLSMLSEALASLDSLGSQRELTFVNGLMSDVLVWSGRRSDAMIKLDEALAFSARTGAAWLDAELHRRKAELLLASADADAAVQELRHAIDTARNQSAKLFELRATISLARLWSGHGKFAEAREQLEPVYTWFTEGFDVPDLQEARKLLYPAGTTA